ncbi:conserved hypothetical protein [Ricinus communis]|uniref:PB1-like domain-containing protein n=1 Tax=Ricinus communis TaxID=3988 RepID=B9SJ02_RICCO|nr:conserved hypothetical protein [Ricinus communis]
MLGKIGFCDNCDSDKFGFFNMEGIVKDLRYSKVLKMGYMKLESGGFYFFEEDKNAMEMLKFIRNGMLHRLLVKWKVVKFMLWLKKKTLVLIVKIVTQSLLKLVIRMMGWVILILAQMMRSI